MSKAEQNCQTQSGPEHHKKSSDLRRHLTTVSDVNEVTLDGRVGFLLAECELTAQ